MQARVSKGYGPRCTNRHPVVCPSRATPGNSLIRRIFLLVLGLVAIARAVHAQAATPDAPQPPPGQSKTKPATESDKDLQMEEHQRLLGVLPAFNQLRR